MVFFVAAIATLGLASCKKDYTCECVVDGKTVSTTEGYKSMKKKDAEAKCEGKVSAGLVSVQFDNNCTLK